MKFDVVIGNPPYQNGRQQIYTSFYTESLEVGKNVSMIFPTGWQEPKNANSLSRMNNDNVKKDKQIVSIQNLQNVFDGVPGAEWTNIVMWKLGYDNGLKGMQLLITEKGEMVETMLPIKKSDIPKPDFIIDLFSIVQNKSEFNSMQEDVSPNRPYGMRSDIWRRPQKYNLPSLLNDKSAADNFRVITSQGIYYANKDYPFPRTTGNEHRHKVFVPKAWGNWSEHNGFGGAYSDIYIGHPQDVCSETYLECGGYNETSKATYLAKYLMTSFSRALMYLNKYSQNNSRGAYAAIPQQDFIEEWWELSIAEIDEKLFEKYNVPNDIKEKVYENIQKRTEENIIDYGPNIKEME